MIGIGISDRLGVALLALWAVAGSGTAQAAMPPQVYEEALASAETHVQIEVTGRALIAPPGPTAPGHGSCRLAGVIKHVFRGAVRTGEMLSVAVPCRHDAATPVPIGGTIYAPVSELAVAGFLELVLEGRPDGSFDVAARGKGVGIIDEITGVPVITAASGSDAPVEDRQKLKQ